MCRKNKTKGNVIVSPLITEALQFFLVRVFDDWITVRQRVCTQKAVSENPIKRQPRWAQAQTSLPVLLFSLQMPQTRCGVQSQRHGGRVIKQPTQDQTHFSPSAELKRTHGSTHTHTKFFFCSSSSSVNRVWKQQRAKRCVQQHGCCVYCPGSQSHMTGNGGRNNGVHS